MSGNPPGRRQQQSSDSEAGEDNFIDEGSIVPSEDSGEDLEANMEQDYRAIPELDIYEDEGVDDQDISDVDDEARRFAEE